MTERKVDVLEHGVAERASALLDSSEAFSLEVGYAVSGDRIPGVEFIVDAGVTDVRMGNQDFLGVPIGDARGSRVELLELPSDESVSMRQDVFTLDIRPTHTVEDLSLRKIVPGGGG